MIGSGEAFRLLLVMVRKYSADPASRALSARHILGAAIALSISENGAGETALGTAEYLAQEAQEMLREEHQQRLEHSK